MKKQRRLALTEEDKILIISDNLKNGWVRHVDEALHGAISNLDDAPYTSVHTLRNLQMDRVYVVNESFLVDGNASQKALAFLRDLKKDALVVSETFSEETIPLLFEHLERIRYNFNRFKTSSKSFPELFYLADTTTEKGIEKGFAIGAAANEVRDMINTPYNYLDAETLADRVNEWGKDKEQVEVDILDKKAIEKLEMGAFLGVNLGSEDEPRLIHLTYKGDPENNEHIALVGKGIMYDTGGYSLKTPKSMPNMKMDMGGAATVIGVFKALYSLKAKVNVSVVIAATDNRIGPEAIVPDDILTSAKGTTIEIISTDAEGRLTLADALWYAQRQGATKLLDVATLTGSVVASLGNQITGAFTNDQTFYKSLHESAEASKEHVWQLPIKKPHRDALKSYSADMANKGGTVAGASVAAAFLEHFVNDGVPWIHLDIAGTAFNKDKGATGAMVRTLVNMFA